jgi:hypothetical protein
MKRKLFIYGTVVLLLVSMLEGCAVLNTLVSQKYETALSPWQDDCMSMLTGDDLCAKLRLHKTLAVGSFAGFVVMLGIALLIDRRDAKL